MIRWVTACRKLLHCIACLAGSSRSADARSPQGDILFSLLLLSSLAIIAFVRVRLATGCAACLHLCACLMCLGCSTVHTAALLVCVLLHNVP